MLEEESHNILLVLPQPHAIIHFNSWEKGGSSICHRSILSVWPRVGQTCRCIKMRSLCRKNSENKNEQRKIASNNSIRALSKENISVFRFIMTFAALTFKWKCSKNANKSLFLPKLLFFFFLICINPLSGLAWNVCFFLRWGMISVCGEKSLLHTYLYLWNTSIKGKTNNFSIMWVEWQPSTDEAAGTQCVCPVYLFPKYVLLPCVHLFQHQLSSRLVNSKHVLIQQISCTPAMQLKNIQINIFFRLRKLG